MLVQATDGDFYRNPICIFKDWILEINDDGVFIKRRGTLMWKSAQRYLSKAGIKCRLLENKPNSTDVINEKLQASSVFQVELLAPIPIPTHADARIHLLPTDLQGEESLTFGTT